MKLRLVIGIFVLSPLLFGETTAPEDDRAALSMGRAILRVDRAMQYEMPEVPSSEEFARAKKLAKEAIGTGGQDRFYFWVSARIYGEIKKTRESILAAPTDESRTRKLNARLQYLSLFEVLLRNPK